MAPMLGSAGRRHGSCCRTYPLGPDCVDFSYDNQTQRRYEQRAWEREVDMERADVDEPVRIEVDLNSRDGRGRVRARLDDRERRTLLVGAEVVLVDPVEGIRTQGELVRVERATGVAAFKANWWGFEEDVGSANVRAC